ncbi:hypothetical protein BXZ70DRAFT_1044891 [Cristinia sonorae]|uniref:DUF4246 domain-containing protein n=1 Tax=Cristinia sonorae TaxID=1940300 RepID=A0A8K0XLR1_9AGAR|nr:hypothetical protein BXZ70DRAFT_1044891 [Cristinia sonorae]
MQKLSWAFRETKGWQEKLKDGEVLARWKEEATAAQESEPLERKLTENMINYVLTELEAYARLTDHCSGIQHACNDSSFCSYDFLPDQVVKILKEGVAKLEDGQVKLQCPPYSTDTDQVVDLIDPSLYSLTYGRTLVHDAQGSISLATPDLEQLRSVGDTKFASERFAWLPSDFFVEEDGHVRLVSPYINNLHRSNKELYDIIPTILSHFIPMFERVLGAIDKTDKPRTRGSFLGTHRWLFFSNLPQYREMVEVLSEYTPLPGRIKHCARMGDVPCIWPPPGVPYDDEVHGNEYADYPGDTYDDRRKAWSFLQPGFSFPDAPIVYEGALERDFRVANLHGRTVQCVVRLESIQLTPDIPDYTGRGWNVEGILNERIIATGVYYFGSENVSKPKLEFRTSIAEPHLHEPEDEVCMQVQYGQGMERCLNQERGSITIPPGLALAFPNIHQYSISPFRLIDPKKPGHCKILTFLLVDPNHRILSTSDVAPQQMSWMRGFVHDSSSTHGVGGTRLGMLPAELRDRIVHNVERLITEKEAVRMRKELTEERSGIARCYNDDVMYLLTNLDG